MAVRILIGDAVPCLKLLPAKSVHCGISSPPYWPQRDYDHPDQIGNEKTFGEYLRRLLAVYEEQKRLLVPDGTLWVNIGDTYQAAGLPSGNLLGVPWRFAFAMQSAGWILRNDCIWAKTKTIPESSARRCARIHEYLFLFSLVEDHYWNEHGAPEPYAASSVNRYKYAMNKMGGKDGARGPKLSQGAESKMVALKKEGVGPRTVWPMAASGCREGHSASFPEELPEKCIKLGCPPGGTVLDPFAGSGTTGLVADKLGRDAILIEINEKYATAYAGARIKNDSPLFADVKVEHGT